MAKTAMMMRGMLALGAGAAAGRQHALLDAGRVVVYYASDPATDGVTFGQAQGTATQLLAQSGIQLEWRCGSPDPATLGERTIAMVFMSETPDEFLSGENRLALAAAWPYRTGATIKVFQKRLNGFLAEFGPAFPGRAMGHVMAHEIVHILEGVNRHSETGLMKAHWTADDLSAIAAGKLNLAPEDVALLRIRFAPQEAVSAAAAIADPVR